MDKINLINAKEFMSSVKFLSTGACSGCEYCNLPDNPSDDQIDSASESYFSWSSCDCCESHLGGDRHPAHYVDSNGDINHINVCTDCLFLISYGQLPEDM